MIQINLIPDIKLEMLKAQKTRNIATSIAIFAGMVAGAVVVVLALIYGAQVGLQAKYKQDIKSEFKRLSDTANINNALTVQNQLAKIDSLNGKRSMDSRLLDVLAQINPPTPDDIKMSKVSVDPSTSMLTIEGSAAGGFPSTDVFRKTILHTNVMSQSASGGDTQTSPLTTDVQISNTSYGQDDTGAKVVRFTATFVYYSGLFDNSLKNVVVMGPQGQKDVTDSATHISDGMFSKAAADLKETK